MIAWRTFTYPAALALLLGACGDNEEPSTGLSAASNNGSSSGTESGSSGSSGGSTNVQPTDGGSESASEATTNSTPGTSSESGSSTDATTSMTTTTTTTTTGMPGVCGDGMINPNEQCDGANLNGFDCMSLGAGGGTLACDPMSCTFDTSMCEPNGGTTG